MTACASPPPSTGHGNESGQGDEEKDAEASGERAGERFAEGAGERFGERAGDGFGSEAIAADAGAGAPTGRAGVHTVPTGVHTGQPGTHTVPTGVHTGQPGTHAGPTGVHAGRTVAGPGCVITADGSYAARLALDGESWFPERWTLDGPEPYAVPLPGNQPEEPGTEVLPLADGRVLIHRLAADRHLFSLLYPTGPGTGELPLGAVECADPATEMRLLPPAPCGQRAYALALGRSATTVWLVAGGAFGPEVVAQVPGRCSGGVWLDGTGRLLALDQERDGRTKSVAVDLEQGGAISPLLQIADDSDDRVLLADPDSGLLLIRSDAPSPGHDRLGWGVLGSTLPVRFPECLRVPDGHSVTPFAIQPGQILTPESCAVALRLDGPRGSWVGVWRPAARRILHLPAPEGWLTGAGLWSREGILQLPYASGLVRCGVARTGVAWDPDEPEGPEPSPEGSSEVSRERDGEPGRAENPGPGGTDTSPRSGTSGAGVADVGVAGAGVAGAEPAVPVVARPVPLQQAPLEGRVPEEVTVG
ncbi:conserved hypothetical protein [Streptomyces scabiei 87.22]|uniref:Uncharacterized protein n=1 Tax=Streptomyces scabiei (strain 87.22) TaxID=680198 RepID=C9ZFS4_STRSW|nr:MULTISPECIES: hypothetical protein [Streptomyces]MDW8472625.1 hypothetical protein [Streptomyces scabiei]MDX2572588.1 hypothetical protein [Streptomyces scabiei]MDX2581009.1 hypothetical protein [Streptomyces scabiei]MDX2631735.1 hypothetical protein [Streptomyces scabiei]MDX2656533.1 hypothetical protein [Streptomyces scabiei]